MIDSDGGKVKYVTYLGCSSCGVSNSAGGKTRISVYVQCVDGQWCRSVVKYGGGVKVRQIKPSSCSRRLEKIVLPSILTHADVKLAELSNNSFE